MATTTAVPLECPECKAPLPPEADKCPRCGSPTPRTKGCGVGCLFSVLSLLWAAVIVGVIEKLRRERTGG